MKKKTKTESSAVKQSKNSMLYMREQAHGQITAEFITVLVILFSLFSVVVFVSIQQKENDDFISTEADEYIFAQQINDINNYDG